MKIKATEIFQKTHNAETKIVLNRGGARSGKTRAIIQLLLLKLITEPKMRAVVVRKTLAILKDTFIFELQEEIDNMGVGKYLKYYKQTANLYCWVTKATIKFIGADEPQKFRGLEANYWVFNEANEIPYEFFQQAMLRMSRHNYSSQNQFFLDFNPSSRYSWVKTQVEDIRDDVTVITSTYKDNPFLSPDAIHEIERLKEVDPDAWIIYGTGEYTDIIGAIYKNFEIVDEFPPECKKIIYGLDFGFTNDPTALIKVGELHGELFYQELLYKTGLTNQDIGEELNRLGVTRNDVIIADSHEPKSIEEIRRIGFQHIKGCRKGPDSIRHGIGTVKNWKMNVTRSSHNLLMELNLYKWVIDRNGMETNKADDKYNHLCDAMRYAVTHQWGIKAQTNIRVY